MKSKKIIITGGCGYIGTVLSEFFLKKNFEVTSIDFLKFGDEGLQHLKNYKKFKNISDDFDNFKKYNEIFNNCDYVIHLASVSGMPSCKKFKKESNYINYVATKKFFTFLKKFGNIKKIILASSTSVFGNKTSTSNELSKCKPISEYGFQKLNCEKFVKKNINDKRFLILRFPTIFGYSPRMRYDLTIHEFARYLKYDLSFDIYNFNSVKPYCEINDLSNIIYKFTLQKYRSKFNLFCVGHENFNLSKKDILNILLKNIKNSSKNYKITNKLGKDKRNYYVSYKRFKNTKLYKFQEKPNKKFINLLKNIKKFNNLDKKKLTSIWY